METSKEMLDRKGGTGGGGGGAGGFSIDSILSGTYSNNYSNIVVLRDDILSILSES